MPAPDKTNNANNANKPNKLNRPERPRPARNKEEAIVAIQEKFNLLHPRQQENTLRMMGVESIADLSSVDERRLMVIARKVSMIRGPRTGSNRPA